MREASPNGRVPLPRRRHVITGGLGALLCVGLTGCGVETGQGPDACSTNPRPITFIGDSLTEGTGNDSGATSRFPVIIGRELVVPVRVLASNGSGYVQVGPADSAQSFPDQAADVAADTGLVVILGSRNDMYIGGQDSELTQEKLDRIERAARLTYKRVRDNAPQADILVIGPPWINPEPSWRIRAVRNAVARAAKAEGMDWVDPLEEGWFAEKKDQLPDGRSRLIADDRIHPNDDGHAYLAGKLLPLISKKVCTP